MCAKNLTFAKCKDELSTYLNELQDIDAHGNLTLRALENAKHDPKYSVIKSAFYKKLYTLKKYVSLSFVPCFRGSSRIQMFVP